MWPHDNAILGLQPDAPAGRLGVNPPWLPDLTMTGLRLGGQSFNTRFWRDDGETRHEVLRGGVGAVLLTTA